LLLILKIKNLKAVNRYHKKATKQGSRYCSFGSRYSSVGIQFVSYKSLFDSAKYVIHIAVAVATHRESFVA